MRRRNRTLSTNDQNAINLLLDHGHSPDHPKLTKLASVVSHERLQAVTKLLGLLDALTVADPPADLTSKTMQRLDRAIGRQVGQRTPAMPQSHLPH